MGIKGNPLKDLMKLLDTLEKNKLIYDLSVQQSGINDVVDCKNISFKMANKY